MKGGGEKTLRMRRRKKYRKRLMSDTGLEGSAEVETRSSEEGCFSVSDTEAESNLSDCFGLSHDKREGFLSFSLGASLDMRGTVERELTKDGKGMLDRKHLSSYFYLVYGAKLPVDPNPLTIRLRQRGTSAALLLGTAGISTMTTESALYVTSHHGRSVWELSLLRLESPGQ